MYFSRLSIRTKIIPQKGAWPIILTKRADDYAQWYNDLVLKADLAEHSDVRGCMVIKPHGYAIWEKMQAALDGMFKDTGHVNAYFPLFIPKSYLGQGGQPCGRLRQGMCRGHTLPTKERSRTRQSSWTRTPSWKRS